MRFTTCGAPGTGCGVAGAGTATALGVLQTHALPRRPRLVLLGLLVGNDVLNNSPALDSKGDKPFYRP